MDDHSGEFDDLDFVPHDPFVPLPSSSSSPLHAYDPFAFYEQSDLQHEQQHDWYPQASSSASATHVSSVSNESHLYQEQQWMNDGYGTESGLLDAGFDPGNLDNWFVRNARNDQTNDGGPDPLLSAQQQQAAAAASSHSMLQQHPMMMQGQSDLQPGMLQQQLRHPMPSQLPQQQQQQPLGYSMQAILNHAPQNYAPPSQLSPAPFMQPLLPHSAAAAASSSVFTGPQVFSSSPAQVGPRLSIPVTAHRPFDELRYARSRQEQMQQMQIREQEIRQEQMEEEELAAKMAAEEDVLRSQASNIVATRSSSVIVATLLSFRKQSGESTEFLRKAIESLVRKLKKDQTGFDELDALLQSVASEGEEETRCVTIQRSLDGRLQIVNRKVIPLEVYARLWRWPEVKKSELIKLPICATAPENQHIICVNPYHYERVVRVIPPPEPPAAASPLDLNAASPLVGVPVCDRNIVDLSRVVIPPLKRCLPHWCYIDYYEHATKVGETFKMAREKTTVTVNGGIDPQGRFCLRFVPNAHRDAAVEDIRSNIGSGVVFQLYQEGRVTIKVLSMNSIFLYAPYMDFVNNTPHAPTTHKLQLGDGEITIFDPKWAYYEMCEQSKQWKKKARQQQSSSSPSPPPSSSMSLNEYYEMCEQSRQRKKKAQQQQSSSSPSPPPSSSMSLSEIRRRFCTVSLSFVKGFGGVYSRKSIKDCPCWIEVELEQPMQLLDQLLMGGHY